MSSKKIIYYLLLFSFGLSWSQKNILTKSKADSLITTLKDLHSDFKKVKLLSRFCGTYNYSTSTYIFLTEAKKIGRKNKDPLVHGVINYMTANYYYFNSKVDSANYYLTKADALISLKKEPTLKASILTTLGGVNKKKGNIIQAIKNYLDAKNILDNIDTLSLIPEEKFKHKGKKLVLSNSLANLYNQLEDYENAIYYYDLANKSALELGSLGNSAVILSNKGELLLKSNNLKEALKILEHAKALKLKAGLSERSIANTQLSIAVAQKEMGLFKDAYKNFTEVLNIFKSINNNEGVATTLYEKGLLELNLQNINEAIINCEKAKKIAFILNNPELKINSCYCLSKAYNKIGKYDKAYQNLNFYITNKDSIFNEKNIKEITKLQMQFEFEKEKQKQKALTQKKEQQRKLYLILALSSFFIVSLLAFFYLNIKKKNLLITNALKDKEILLKEIHHRVKNNLQVVSSLLSLQQYQTKDKTANLALQEGRNRVKAMALIHQNLYQDEKLVGVNTQEYIEKLVKNLVATYKTDTKNIKIITAIDNLKLDIDTIIPLGLIINELISNALKYAFTEKDSGVIKLSLKQKDDMLVLMVLDNGIGLPKDFSVKNSESLGYNLIHSFSQKLQADLSVETIPEGTQIILKIKKFKLV